MKNILLILFITLTSFTEASNDITNEYKNKTIEVQLPVVVSIEFPELRFGLDNEESMITFIKYVKTQSNRLNTANDEKDVYAVIQTIYNRLEYKECTWDEYYNSPKLNNSKSIKLMKSGKLRKRFSFKNKKDTKMYRIAYNCNMDLIDEKYKIPKDILYFESFSNPPDKGPHLMKNFYVKYRHRFYKK